MGLFNRKQPTDPDTDTDTARMSLQILGNDNPTDAEIQAQIIVVRQIRAKTAAEGNNK